ncbi:helix-turn-helix transcriptional regulator [Enterobacter asburiae]|uniref:helix-turn-helix transcriptional regulator n=1 Tax=Enterobacter asburiae TaxID=61645 RepID=UPI0032AF1B29
MVNILIDISDSYYAFGLQEYLKCFFDKRKVPVAFYINNRDVVNIHPDIYICAFVKGEIYSCSYNQKFHNAKHIVGITDQKCVERDIPNCLKGMKVIGYKSTLEELEKALRFIISDKEKHNPGKIFFKKIGCYNCKSAKLSEREINIIQRMLSGESSVEIVKQLEISIKTFYAHKYNISRKFGLRGDSEFVRFIRKIVII